MFDELRSGRCEISRLLQYQVSNWSELGDDLVGTNFRQACAVVRSEGPSSGKTFRVNHWDLYLRLILESAEGLNPTHLEVYHNAGHQRISTSQCTLGQLMGHLNVHALWTLHCSVHWKFPAAKTQSRSHELCELQEASLQNKENHFKTNSHFNKREILAPKCCELRCSWAKVSIWGAESRQLQAQTIDKQLPSKKSKSSFVKEFKVLKKWIFWKCLEHVEPFGSLGSTDPQPLLLRTECQQYSSWMHGSAMCDSMINDSTQICFCENRHDHCVHCGEANIHNGKQSHGPWIQEKPHDSSPPRARFRRFLWKWSPTLLSNCLKFEEYIQSVYSPLNSVSRKRTLQQSSNSFLFCRPTQGLVRTNMCLVPCYSGWGFRLSTWGKHLIWGRKVKDSTESS